MEETEKKQIPEMNVSDNKIVVDTKDIPLIVNGETVQIKMRKLPIGEKQGLVKTSAQTKMVGSQVTGTIDAVGYQIGVLSKVIIDAPFPFDLASIRELDEKVVDYLFTEYEEWTAPKKKD